MNELHRDASLGCLMFFIATAIFCLAVGLAATVFFAL